MEIVEQTKQNCLQLYLPNEVVNTILEYQGYHIWRNGKFMRRLNINDKKYDSIKNLNIIKKINDDSYMVTIIIMKKNKFVYKYTIEQTISSNLIHWNMYIYWYRPIHPNKKRYETKYVLAKDIPQNLVLLRMHYSYRI